MGMGPAGYFAIAWGVILLGAMYIAWKQEK
jgi:hypothetical protein